MPASTCAASSSAGAAPSSAAVASSAIRHADCQGVDFKVWPEKDYYREELFRYVAMNEELAIQVGRAVAFPQTRQPQQPMYPRVTRGLTMVNDAGCVADSFPGFVEIMQSLGAQMEWI